MWEFSLYFDRQLLPYFQQLKSELKKLCDNELNVVAIQPEAENFVFLMAFTKEFYNKNISLLKGGIANIICLYYKPEIIAKNIQNFDLKKHQNIILLSILASIDFYIDKSEIAKNLSLIDEMYLTSYVNFKLQNLKKRWKEIGELINENSLFLMDNDVQNELTRFLLHGVACRYKTIKLTLENNNITMKNEKDEEIIKNNFFCIGDDKQLIIFSLINNGPETIEIENYKNFDAQFISEIYNIFGERVKLLEQ